MAKSGHTGTEILRNIVTPFLTSVRATSCGVETITAPAARNQHQHSTCSPASLTINHHKLTKGEWDVPCARRHIKNQNIKSLPSALFSPVDVEQELLDGFLYH